VTITSKDSTISLISYKRAVSTEFSYSTKRTFAPLIYKSTSLYKLRDFLLNYNVYFNTIKEHTVHRQIAITALYIQDNVLH
jgi:ubiquinone biosynthesis protein COQ9